MIFCTIIIPFQNSKKTIKKCINSICKQDTILNYQVILINDFSTDGSAKIVKDIIKDKKNFKLLNSKKKTIGPGYARNLGIRIAKGKYIYFLDSDDQISKNCFSELSKLCLKKKYPDLICNSFLVKDEIGNLNKKRRYDLNLLIKNRKEIITNFFNLSIIPQVISNLIKKKLIKENKIYFKDGYFEDIFFILRVFYFSKKIVGLKKNLYLKTNRKNSIVNTISLEHVKDSLKAYYQSYKFIKSIKMFNSKIIDNLFNIALVGQVAVIYTRINNKKISIKIKKILLDELGKKWLKYSKLLKNNYNYFTKKDMITKRFLYKKKLLKIKYEI